MIPHILNAATSAFPVEVLIISETLPTGGGYRCNKGRGKRTIAHLHERASSLEYQALETIHLNEGELFFNLGFASA